MIPRAWRPHAAILLLGLAAYAPVLTVGFLYDDHLLIESNTALRSWSTAPQDFSRGVFGPSSEVDLYRPLQMLSNRVEFSLWKLNPIPYHLANLLLHLGNALLVYELIAALGFSALVASLAGSLFVIHPIIVEHLLMVSGRGELMALFFALASLLVFLRVKTPRMAAAGTLIAYSLALLSKEGALITPALLAAILYYRKESACRYLFLIPMAVVSGLYLLARQHALGTFGPPIWTMEPIRFFLSAFPQVLFYYARILLLPFDLHTDRVLSLSHTMPYAALAAGTLLAQWVFIRGPRWSRFCFLWYVLIFLPKAPLMIAKGFMSDHWAYPALLAIVLPLSIALSRGWDSPRENVRRLTKGLAILLVAAGIGTTLTNIFSRNTDEKLYRSALKYRTTPTMQFNLALILLQQNRLQEALSLLESLHASYPLDVEFSRTLAAAKEALHRR